MSANQVRDGARRSSPPSKRGLAALFAAPEFYRERRRDTAASAFEQLFEPVVLLLAITLFTIGVVQFGLAMAPNWAAEGLVPLCTAAALVAYYYSLRLERATVFWREWLVLLLPFVLVVRFLPYATHPGWDLGADVQLWMAQPLSFLELGFVFSALLLIGAWTTAFFSAQDLADIRVQRGEVPELPARTIIERAWESDRVRGIDHTTPYRRLIGRFIQGGIVLIVLAAMTAANVRQIVTIENVVQLLSVQHPSSALALLDVLAYWVAVLLLMVEAHYVRTRTLWTLDRVPISPGLAARWAGAGVALVLLGLLAAVLAPTEGLLGIGDMVTYALAFLFAIASYVMAAFYLLFWLITLPLRWLMGGGTEVAAPAPTFAPPPLPPESGGSSLFDLVKSVLFWAVFAGFVLYTLVVLWRQGTLHRVVPGIGRLGAIVSALVALLWRWLSGLGRLLFRGAVAVAHFMRPAVGASLGRARPGWLRDLLPSGDPRRVVIATYTLIAARAAQRGIGRPPGETASEYRVRLRTALPDAAGEVDQLTDAFLRARYGRAPVGQGEVGLVRRCWRRIREGLRSTRPR
jgi:hypothetical protein